MEFIFSTLDLASIVVGRKIRGSSFEGISDIMDVWSFKFDPESIQCFISIREEIYKEYPLFYVYCVVNNLKKPNGFEKRLTKVYGNQFKINWKHEKSVQIGYNSGISGFRH